MEEESIHTNKSETKYLQIFFALTFGISWLSFGAEQLAVLLNWQEITLFFIQRITKFGPTIAGLITAAIYSPSRLRQLVKDQFRLKISWKWYIVVLVFPALIMAIAIGIHLLLGDSVITGINWLWPDTLVQLFYWLGLRIFLGGGFGEELGFRGFAWPLMEKKFGYRKAGWLLGIIWGLWHLPGILTSSNIIVLLVFQLIFTCALNFIFINVYTRTKGNIWILSLLHGALNGWNAFYENSLLPALKEEDLWLFVYVFVLIVIALVWRRKKDAVKNHIEIHN